MHEIVTRPYASTDLLACLTVFDGNVPDFFAPTERAEFQAHLRDLAEPAPDYLVLTHAGAVVGCGGVSLGEQHGDARLVWGMVAREWQGRGLGRRLLQERLALARGFAGLRTVSLSTSQNTRGFYERAGFILTGVVPDGFGAGLDQCDMVLTLSQGSG